MLSTVYKYCKNNQHSLGVLLNDWISFRRFRLFFVFSPLQRIFSLVFPFCADFRLSWDFSARFLLVKLESRRYSFLAAIFPLTMDFCREAFFLSKFYPVVVRDLLGFLTLFPSAVGSFVFKKDMVQYIFSKRRITRDTTDFSFSCC